MGIKDNIRQVAQDFLLGRAVREMAEQHAPEEGPSPEDPLAHLEESPGVGTVSMSDLVRRTLYDSQHDGPEETLSQIGWPTPSLDVIEMEAKASERRLSAVETLDPLVHALAQALMLPLAKAEGWDQKEFDDEYEFTAHASMAIISQLVDLGLMENSSQVTNVGYYIETQEDEQ